MNFNIEEDDEAFVKFVDYLDENYRSLCVEVNEMLNEHSFQYVVWSELRQRLKKLKKLHRLTLEYWDEHVTDTTAENLESIRSDLLESYTKLYITHQKSLGKMMPSNAFDRLLAKFTERSE